MALFEPKIMKYLFLIVLFFTLNIQAQTTVKSADKAEYAKYLTYCNTPIDRPFDLVLKVSVLKINGQYLDASGNWVTSKTPTITLVAYGTKSITTTESQKQVSVRVMLPVQRRTPSIPDFYKYWITHFIQDGLMDERSGGY